jgi:hypothetical protein
MAATKEVRSMNALVRGLMWPVISLVVIGTTHLLAEMLRPALQTVFVPTVIMPVLLVVGGWTGVAVVRAGGTFVHGLVGAAVIGLFPVVLQLVGFGVILGRSWDAVVTTATFAFVAMFWGGSIGSGIASSLQPRAAVQTSPSREPLTAPSRA